MKVKSSYTSPQDFSNPTLHQKASTRTNMNHTPGFLQLVADAKTRIRELTVSETRARLIANPAARLIDVREDHEWQTAHAHGAHHMGRGIIERDIETAVPNLDTELILYCGGGYRSALAALALKHMGYTNVHSMAGGWTAWQESGAPTESD
jgi:rhodanese-related sulfurtransferase